MKVEITQGQPVIDAKDAGAQLHIALVAVLGKMRTGEMTGWNRMGRDKGFGRFRLISAEDWMDPSTARLRQEAR